jgi:hypothetical protein
MYEDRLDTQLRVENYDDDDNKNDNEDDVEFVEVERDGDNDQLWVDAEEFDILVDQQIDVHHDPAPALIPPNLAMDSGSSNIYFWMVVFLLWMTRWSSSITSADAVSRILAVVFTQMQSTIRFPRSVDACIKALHLQSRIAFATKILCRSCCSVYDLAKVVYKETTPGFQFGKMKQYDCRGKIFGNNGYTNCERQLVDVTQNKSGEDVCRPYS